MKRQMARLVTLALLAGVFALAGGSQAAEYTMKFSAGNGPLKDHHAHTPILNFAKEVNQQSNGRINVKIFWNYTLGKNEKVLNLIRQGLVEGICTSDGHAVPYYSNLEILSIPYLFANRKVAYEVLDGPFIQKFNENMAQKSGIRPLGWFENAGYRHFTANKPLRTIADFKGLKIRTMKNAIHMQIVRSLGASPTPIAWGDLYTSLQTGVVDGQENALGTMRLAKLEEVQKNIILDGHVYSISGFFVSEKWFKKLPADLQQVVRAAAEHAVALNRKMAQRDLARDKTYMKTRGVTIYDPPQEVKDEFKRLTQKPAIETLRKNVDGALIDELLQTVKEAEAKVNG